MRLSGYAILSTLLLLHAARAQNDAQNNAAIAVPPAPPMVAAPAVIPPPAPAPPPAPPGLVVSPVPPPNTDIGSAPSATAPGAPTSTPPAPPANNWLPGATVKLGVLDKIDGTVSEVTIATGAQAEVGDLMIAVQSCVTRPPGEIPDAAVFLTAQNPQNPAAAPLYRGWIVRSIPGATVVGDASETFRIIDCS